MQETAATLTEKLNSEIPISKAMGIRVTEYTSHNILLTAPLPANINHKSTAFGGSLYSAAVLAGWALLYAKLQESQLEAHIVIAESHASYMRPVKQDIQAICRMPDETTMQRFQETFTKRGRARILLVTEIMTGDLLAMTLRGRYVIHI